MHWCDFCKTNHSSMSCYHPGNPKNQGNYPMNGDDVKADAWTVQVELTRKVKELEGKLEEREKERSALSSRLAQYAQASLAPGNEQRKRIADLEDRLDTIRDYCEYREQHSAIARDVLKLMDSTGIRPPPMPSRLSAKPG